MNSKQLLGLVIDATLSKESVAKFKWGKKRVKDSASLWGNLFSPHYHCLDSRSMTLDYDMSACDGGDLISR